MKRSLLLALILLLILFSAHAATVCGDYSYIVQPDGTARITDYSGTDTHVVIPETLDGLTVTCIGDSAMDRNETIESVYIPDTVTVIQDYAFWYDTNLTSIRLSQNLTSIGNDAFRQCGISSIEIPDSVTEMSSTPFGACMDLTEIVFSPENTRFRFEDGALIDATNHRFLGILPALAKEECVVPSDVTEIGNSAFSWCEALRSVILPEGVTRVNGLAFDHLENLTSITLPGTLTFIGYKAFNELPTLETLVIPAGVTQMRENAFRACPRLTLTVSADSFALDYAVKYRIPHIIAD